VSGLWCEYFLEKRQRSLAIALEVRAYTGVVTMVVVGYWERIAFGGEDEILRRKEVVERSVEEKAVVQL